MGLLFPDQEAQEEYVHAKEAASQTKTGDHIHTLVEKCENRVTGEEDSEPNTDMEPQAEQEVHGGLHEVVVLEADEEEVAEDGQDDAAVGCLGDSDHFFALFCKEEIEHS